MLVAAGLESKTPAEIADAYEAAFHADAALVNILPAHVFPRATEHIAEMIALAERLEDGGHAYVTDAGNVYYAVATFPGYGALSGNTLDELRAGHRGEVEPDKRDPADFALWKAAGEGRLLQLADRALGRGLPGLAPRVLGDGDCATSARGSTSTPAAIDNVFPHHEDEIAQSAPIVGGPPARLWVHGEHLLRPAGRWPSRPATSSGSRTSSPTGIDPLAFRYLALHEPLPAQARRTRGRVAGRRGGRAGVAPRARSPALGPAPADGPVGRAARRSWPPAAGPAPDRDRPRASPATAASRAESGPGPRSGARAGRPAERLPGARLHEPLRRRDRRRPRPADRPGRRPRDRSAPTSRADERRWLVLDADFVLGLDLDRAGMSARTPDGAAVGAPGGRPLDRRADRRARAAGDYARADALRDGAARPSGSRSPTTRTATTAAGGGRRAEQVAPGAEPVEHPVEVALAQPVALGRPAGSSSRGARGGSPAASTATARRGGLPSPSSRRTRLHQMSRLR